MANRFHYKAVVIDVAMSRDGAFLATATEQNEIQVRAVRDGKQLRSLNAAGGRIGSIQFAPTSDRLLSSHSDGKARLWRPARDDQIERQFFHGRQLAHAEFAPNGRSIATVGGDGGVRFWMLDGAEAAKPMLTEKRRVVAVRFSPDGAQLGIADFKGVISVWDIAQRSCTIECDPILRASCFVFVDHTHIAAGTRDGNIHILSLRTGASIRNCRLNLGASIVGIALLADQECLVVMLAGGNMCFVNLSLTAIRDAVKQSTVEERISLSQDGTRRSTCGRSST